MNWSSFNLLAITELTKIYIFSTVYFDVKAKTLFKENNKLTTLANIVFFWVLILVIFMIVTKSEMKNIALN